jgi:hypothetical protein
VHGALAARLVSQPCAHAAVRGAHARTWTDSRAQPRSLYLARIDTSAEAVPLKGTVIQRIYLPALARTRVDGGDDEEVMFKMGKTVVVSPERLRLLGCTLEEEDERT